MAHGGLPVPSGGLESGGMGGVGGEPIVASHVVVGAGLHLAMSAVAGIAFALVLAVLIRAGLRLLATPVAFVGAAMAGGALLYAIMLYAVAPHLNRTIVDFTPRVPFFLAHLAFGAVLGIYVYWRPAGVRPSVLAIVRDE
jgi:hypothetical protein